MTIKEVYFHPASATFTDDSRQKITLDQARKAWLDAAKTGDYLDCNLAFSRLVWNDFDVERTLNEYND